jgi:TRAP-type C4-dicarboxylate transport system substrate-binding protein
MKMMERIVIEVEDRIAQKWRYKNTKSKQHLAKSIGKMLEIMLDKPDEDFREFLEKAREAAEAKGFNDEILNRILSEE